MKDIRYLSNPKTLDILILLLFTLGSFLFFEINYRFMYRFLEQYMMFQYTDIYFKTMISQPGGMNEYLTEFISQVFLLPYMAPLIIALLLGTMTGLVYLFIRRLGVGVSMLIAAIPAFLFWIWPVESMASVITVIIALLSANLYAVIKKDWIRYIVSFVLITFCYLLAAPASILLAVLLLIFEFAVGKEKINCLIGAIWLFWALILPLICMHTLYVVPLREAYISKHLYHPEHLVPFSFWIQWISIPLLLTIIYGFCNKTFIKKDSIKAWLYPSGLILIMTVTIIGVNRPLEQAYRYDYYARTNQWERIVEHAEKKGINDKDALVYLNLALSKTGRFDEFIQYRQIGEDGLIPYDPKSRLGLIEAAEVAWHLNFVNSAQRFAFEGVITSQRRIQPRLMMRLVETYLVNQEYKVAEKYIKILESTGMYREWAREKRALLDPLVCESTPWIMERRAINMKTDNAYDLTKTLPNALAYMIDDHLHNKPAFEYAMGYLLIYKDFGTLMYYMELLRDNGMPIPTLYQEAICLFYAAVKSDPQGFRSFRIDQNIQDRFANFLKVAPGLPAAALKQQYGDTYYYYAQFVNAPKRTK